MNRLELQRSLLVEIERLRSENKRLMMLEGGKPEPGKGKLTTNAKKGVKAIQQSIACRYCKYHGDPIRLNQHMQAVHAETANKLKRRLDKLKDFEASCRRAIELQARNLARAASCGLPTLGKRR